MTWPIFRADPDTPQSTPWQPGEVVRIGSLGRLHAVKGYDVLLRAVAGLQRLGMRFELTIAGEGAERAALEAWVAEHDVRDVRFLGFAADPRSFLAGLHLYVQPSWSEGFCIAAHEAMQAGLPVIASAVGELAHSVKPGRTGELVMPGAVEPLAGKIASLIADPDRMAAMGVLARNRVLQHFGPDAFEAHGRAVVERLVSPDGVRAGAGSRAAPRSQGRGATARSA